MSASTNPDQKPATPVRRLTISDIARLHADGTRIAMVTAYDYPTARLLDEAGIPLILVGDSLGRVVLGYENEIPVSMDDMLHHAKAVVRGAGRRWSSATCPSCPTRRRSRRSRTPAGSWPRPGVQAVKVEGGRRSARTIEAIVRAGIPVMGHIGLTPQAINQIGRLRVQGKTREAARDAARRCARASRRPARSRSCWSSSRSSSPRRSPSACGSRRSASAPGPAAAARSRSSPTCSASRTGSPATPGRTPTCAR